MNSIVSSLNDITSGLAQWRVWLSFAMENIQRIYHRTLFGSLWISLSFCLFLAVKFIVFGTLFNNTDSRYSAYLMLGFLAWVYANQIVLTATMVFVSNAGWIKNDSLPMSVYAFESVTQDFFSFVMSLLAVIALYWLTNQPIDWHALMFFPAVAVIIFNAFWLKLSLGIICARYRDVTQLVSAAMRAMLFLSPVFWMPEQMSDRVMSVLWWNPFMHFIDIIRLPILDHHFAVDSWIYVGGFTVLNVAISLTLFSVNRRRIAFWL